MTRTPWSVGPSKYALTGTLIPWRTSRNWSTATSQPNAPRCSVRPPNSGLPSGPRALRVRASAAPAAAESAAADRAQTLSNREIVERFIDLFYRQGRVREAFETYVAENYIQHNPLAPDGRAAAIAALRLCTQNVSPTAVTTD